MDVAGAILDYHPGKRSSLSYWFLDIGTAHILRPLTYFATAMGRLALPIFSYLIFGFFSSSFARSDASWVSPFDYELDVLLPIVNATGLYTAPGLPLEPIAL